MVTSIVGDAGPRKDRMYVSSVHGVSGRLSSLAHGLPGGVEAQDVRHAADVCLGLLLWRSGNCFAIHMPLGGDQCGEQHGPRP